MSIHPCSPASRARSEAVYQARAFLVKGEALGLHDLRVDALAGLLALFEDGLLGTLGHQHDWKRRNLVRMLASM
jgi:hypothetical protein